MSPLGLVGELDLEPSSYLGVDQLEGDFQKLALRARVHRPCSVFIRVFLSLESDALHFAGQEASVTPSFHLETEASLCRTQDPESGTAPGERGGPTLSPACRGDPREAGQGCKVAHLCFSPDRSPVCCKF